MSFSEMLDQLAELTLAERQLLVRRALDIDDPGLSAGEATVVQERLAAYHADPASALSLQEMEGRLRARFPA